jgi:predicted phosphodiesterase
MKVHLQAQEPLLLFGGPYSNLQATQALKHKAQQLGISPGNIICTGDTIAYCAQPNETIELLREWGVHILMGNCEESLAMNAANCGCGFEAGTLCSALSEGWYSFAKEVVKPHHKQWLGKLPRRINFTYQDKHFVVVHGSIEHINEFVFPSTDFALKSNQLTVEQADGVIAGHSGLPFTQIIDNRLWHNPGVIGMPANDGTPRVWYSLWRPIQGQLLIEHHCLNYNARVAAEHMRQAGLDNDYADALLSGLWPSMDVLPEEERARRGQSIATSCHSFL